MAFLKERLPWVVTTLLVLITTGAFAFRPKTDLGQIGATASITEASSGLELTARVDTGAKVTSLHCGQEDLVIQDPSPEPIENLGKPALLRISNKPGRASWVRTRIRDFVEVRNAEHAEHRYCVELPLRYRGVEKQTLVTLNDRSSMSYRLLLGRNFLHGNFVVDVTQ